MCAWERGVRITPAFPAEAGSTLALSSVTASHGFNWNDAIAAALRTIAELVVSADMVVCDDRPEFCGSVWSGKQLDIGRHKSTLATIYYAADDCV
jgi:hypothetical protein